MDPHDPAAAQQRESWRAARQAANEVELQLQEAQLDVGRESQRLAQIREETSKSREAIKQVLKAKQRLDTQGASLGKEARRLAAKCQEQAAETARLTRLLADAVRGGEEERTRLEAKRQELLAQEREQDDALKQLKAFLDGSATANGNGSGAGGGGGGGAEEYHGMEEGAGEGAGVDTGQGVGEGMDMIMHEQEGQGPGQQQGQDAARRVGMGSVAGGEQQDDGGDGAIEAKASGCSRHGCGSDVVGGGGDVVGEGGSPDQDMDGDDSCSAA